MGSNDAMKKADEALRVVALGFPETYEEFPWGHRAVKVKKKAFVFMALENGRFSLSVKLPQSSEAALMFPFASPTGYGLGKSGWVTAAFEKSAKVPIDLLSGWLEESYRAVAPKKLSARLAGSAGAQPPPGKSAGARPSAREKASPRERASARGASSRTSARTTRAPKKAAGSRSRKTGA